MKISGTQGVSRAAASTRTSRVATAAKTARVRHIEDVASIVNLSPADMSDKVRDAIMLLLEEVSELRSELDLAQARIADLTQLVDLDPMLPVANRRAFVREMSRLMSFSQRYGTSSSLLFIDINDVKKLNDRFGHAAGDAALMHVAQLLEGNIRDVDVIGRLGGDEFGILLVQVTEEQAQVKAEALAELVAATPFRWDNQELKISVAYGVYAFTDSEDPAEALACADQRMYENKRLMKAQN